MSAFLRYKTPLLFLLAFIHTYLVASPANTWQQEVNYNIDVSLNDKEHELNGTIAISYSNNSPDTLRIIYFHLWPNAYSSNQTAFAKQWLGWDDREVHFIKEEDRGHIDELDFRVNGFAASFKLDLTDPDIGVLQLNQPLLPGQSVEIFTPFKVKLPESISRLGHKDQSYQISQWYPKPAVYDEEGWHPMPYLDQGEFYSEFGSFDVSITLPANYIVGATGNLQNERELAWLNEKALATDTVTVFPRRYETPESDPETKTLRYIIDNVHDFAWFADKDFHVMKGEVTLASGKKVTSWSMFTNFQAKLWKESINYINAGIEHYSEYVGEYPYDVVTAVESALSAGGGMEYPTITVIGAVSSARVLETVIVHEVGHNWFYGQLGFNEREYPWLDEGINSFYEDLYYTVNYPDAQLIYDAPRLNNFFGLNLHRNYGGEQFYLFAGRRNIDQAINTSSEGFTSSNYGAIAYSKAALSLAHLRGYLGEEVFDNCMKTFYRDWEFKHPGPEDLERTFEVVSGQDLDWYFKDVVGTKKKLDYKINKVKKPKEEGESYQIAISNQGQLTTPVSISAMYRDSVVSTKWYPGFSEDTIVSFPQGNYTAFRIDAAMQMPQIQRSNDSYRLRGLIHKTEPFRFQLIGSLEDPYRTQVFFMPILGWNNYDKTLVGLAIYNHLLPSKRFQFELLPFYATATNTITGLGRIGYNWLPSGGRLQKIDFNVYGKRFSYDLFNEPLAYNKFMPLIRLDFKPKTPNHPIKQAIELRTVTIWQEFLFSNRDIQNDKRIANFTVFDIGYGVGKRDALYPMEANINLQQGREFTKLWAEAKVNIRFNAKNDGLELRAFAGAFLWNNITSGTVPDVRFRLNYAPGVEQFQRDPLFDELFLGRNDVSGIFSQQIARRDAGFRSRTSFGQTGNWMAAFNISSSIIGKVPVRPYMSFAFFGLPNSRFNVAFEAGLTIRVIKDILEVNLPLATIVQSAGGTQTWHVGLNKNDQDNANRGRRYWSLITFVVNLKKANPFSLFEQIEF